LAGKSFSGMTNILRTTLSGLALLMVACGPFSGEPAPPRPRSILLVSIDTLRADHLGAYGYPRPTSPFLDELAGEGTLFETAISSAPWTLPAHASLFSGLYPSTHRAVDGSEAIADTVTLAAEIFQQEGFATGGFVASWFVSENYGFDRGFDQFESFQQTLKNNHKNKIPAAQVVNGAVDWLQANGENPFFLFVHLYDAHFNYNPPAEHGALFETGYVGPRPLYRNYFFYGENQMDPGLLAQEIAMYDGEIHYIDAELRRLHEKLEEMGLANDVLVVVTADHGEEFFERGSWGHAHTLYDEVIRVPLIARGPGVMAGQRWQDQVRHVDLLPTLLEAFELPAAGGLHGRSLWPILTRGEDRVPAVPGDGGSDATVFEGARLIVGDGHKVSSVALLKDLFVP
jgi:arylsulfatase A-like enzyme